MKRLFSAYRLDQYPDPDGFMANCALLMSEYPDVVLSYVTDPRTGVQRRQVFPPSPAEIAKACDERMDKLIQDARNAEFQARRNLAKIAERPREYAKPGQMTYGDFLERFPDRRPVGRFEKHG